MKRTFILTFFLLCQLITYGYSISGKLCDSNIIPIEFGNVQIYTNDSIFIGGTITDSNGLFKIDNISNGEYAIVFSAVGFNSKTQYCIIKNQDIFLESIVLHQNNILLEEVIVMGKRSNFKVKECQFTIDVQKAGLQEQSDILDVLSFLPGVTSSGDNISVIGFGKTLFLLNGVEVKSFDRIKAINPDQIKEISLNNNPSAKYSSIYSNIISISTIEKLSDYASSQISHSSMLGRRYSNEESININLSRKKWDNFFTYHFSDDKGKNSAVNIYDIYLDESYERNNYSQNEENTHAYGHQITEGLTYRPTDLITFNLQYDMNISDNNFKVNTNEYSIINQIYNEKSSNQELNKKISQHNLDLVGEYKINNSQNLTFSTGYLYNQSSSKNDIVSLYGDNSYIQGKNKYRSWALKVDYAYFLQSGYNINTGISYSKVKNSGLSVFYNGETYENSYFDDKTLLEDNNAAIYGSIQKKGDRFFASLGLRGELFASNYKKNGTIWLDENTFKLYPTINFQYTINHNVTLTGGFFSRSSRPTFRELSPLLQYVNAYLFEQGNPTLKQADIYTTSLSLIFKNKFVIQTRYIRYNHATMWSFKESDAMENVLINSPSNINYDSWLFNSSYSDAFGKYRFSYNTSVQYIPTKINYLSRSASRSPQIRFTTINQFVLTPKTLMSINIGYTSKNSFLGVEQKAIYDISFWIRQSFFKNNRLQIILKGEDLLHKAISKSCTTINNVKSATLPNLDSKFIGLTIRYNINGFKNIFNRKNINEDTENRIR